jgi:hypothetical protein
MARGKATEIRVNSNQDDAGGDDGWVKIGGGGPWKGTLWHPGGATKNTVEKAAEYGNAIVDDKVIQGTLHSGSAFNKKDVFYVKHDKHGDLLLPEHGGLMADCEVAIEKMGEGCQVRISYKGTAKLQGGRFKGNSCHTYDVLSRRA